jgi:hypothetical protein
MWKFLEWRVCAEQSDVGAESVCWVRPVAPSFSLILLNFELDCFLYLDFLSKHLLLRLCIAK